MISADNGRPLDYHEITIGTKLLSLDNDLNPVISRVIGIQPTQADVIRVSTKMGSEILLTLEQKLRSIVTFSNVYNIGIDGCIASVKRGGLFLNKSVNKKDVQTTAAKALIGEIDRLPPWTFDLSKEQTAILLIHLFSSTSSASLFNKFSTIFINGFELCRDIRAILSKLGIVSSITKLSPTLYSITVEPDRPHGAHTTAWDTIDFIEHLPNHNVNIIATDAGNCIVDGILTKV